MAEGVPEDAVGVADGPVLLRPLTQPIVQSALVRVLSCSVPLAVSIRSHPYMVVHEPRPLAPPSLLGRVRDGVVTGYELVGSRVAWQKEIEGRKEGRENE